MLHFFQERYERTWHGKDFAAPVFSFFFKWIKIEGLEKSWLMYGGNLQYWGTVIKKVILLFLFFFEAKTNLKNTIVTDNHPLQLY